ncbi:hypothetical protein N7447_004018 [Penicillium robsamsonii]|uniref:uncharacterized protein n=1 Tax=Penicillium robsamsonii TaxID=1792511 RepID=UPI0025495145|nr:uncharacterized protein N7447_004018 [Penicillium robsamsonii]KAJ5827255.1 hypothetical protein N7447_004018 [Penicillium robsamsonii]
MQQKRPSNDEYRYKRRWIESSSHISGSDLNPNKPMSAASWSYMVFPDFFVTFKEWEKTPLEELF